MAEEGVVPCVKCQDGHHQSCLRPMAIPMIPSSRRVATFSESRTFTCCDKQDFWTRRSYPTNEAGK